MAEHHLPKGLTGWAWFVAAVFIAVFLINTASNKFPTIGNVESGLTW